MNFKTINVFYHKHKNAIDLSLFFIVVFAYFFVLLTSQFKLDDLIYMNKWESSEPIRTFSDIYQYQVQHYVQWGGRTIAHTILQLLLIMPKVLSALLITLCFAGLAILMFKMTHFNQKVDWLIVTLILSLFYFFNPTPEETLFWYTGIANYLITGLIILLSFYPFIVKLNGKVLKPHHYCLIPFAFFAGWCNENMSTSLVVMMAVVLYVDHKRYKKWDGRLVCSIIFAMMGVLLLLLAPGNFARASTISSGFMSILYRGHGQINAWFNWLLLPIVTLLATLNTNKENNFDLSNNIFTLWGILSILFMIASPIYPSRATFGSLILLITSIVMNIKKNDFKNNPKFNTICILFGLGLALTLVSIGVLQFARNMGIGIPG